MLRNAEFRIQMKDAVTLESIITAGGKAIVCKPGSPDKATLYTAAGAALANPITPSRGFLNFFTAETETVVDLYVMSPTGHFQVFRGVEASGPNEILIDTANVDCAIVIPFSIADTTANTLTATGITVPANALLKPFPAVNVTTAEAARTVSLGVSGTATAVLAATSVAAAGLIKGALGTRLNSTGALIADDQTKGQELAYTLAASTAAAKGFITVPYLLAA